MYDDKYLYVIELPSGEVKVGMTEDPKTRLKMYGYDAHLVQQPFISDKTVGPARECEKIICYRLRKYLHRGREFFKCDFDLAVQVTKDVLGELENGDPSDFRCPETEAIRFHSLDVGTTRKLLEGAKEAGFGTARQFFINWVEGLK